MTIFIIAFENIDGVPLEQMLTGKIIPGYKNFLTHMIFDNKMGEKFTRKSSLVSDRHKTRQYHILYCGTKGQS